jgi:hypothetical protein
LKKIKANSRPLAASSPEEYKYFMTSPRDSKPEGKKKVNGLYGKSSGEEIGNRRYLVASIEMTCGM